MLEELIEQGYYSNDGEPLKCVDCESSNFKEKVTDFAGVHPCEMKIICKSCGHVVGYWAYGEYITD